MTDDEVADRLLEMREATARRCVEIAWEIRKGEPTPSYGTVIAGRIISAIKKEFGLEE